MKKSLADCADGGGRRRTRAEATRPSSEFCLQLQPKGSVCLHRGHDAPNQKLFPAYRSLKASILTERIDPEPLEREDLNETRRTKSKRYRFYFVDKTLC